MDVKVNGTRYPICNNPSPVCRNRMIVMTQRGSDPEEVIPENFSNIPHLDFVCKEFAYDTANGGYIRPCKKRPSDCRGMCGEDE